MNKLFCVHPDYQRQGVATYLISSVFNQLHQQDEALFWSACLISNEHSRNWHYKFGFEEQPQLPSARERMYYLSREVKRHTLDGNKEQARALQPALEEAIAAYDYFRGLPRDEAYLLWRDDI